MLYSASVAGIAPQPRHWYSPPQSPVWQSPRPRPKWQPVRPHKRPFQRSGTVIETELARCRLLAIPEDGPFGPVRHRCRLGLRLVGSNASPGSRTRVGTDGVGSGLADADGPTFAACRGAQAQSTLLAGLQRARLDLAGQHE